MVGDLGRLKGRNKKGVRGGFRWWSVLQSEGSRVRAYTCRSALPHPLRSGGHTLLSILLRVTICKPTYKGLAPKAKAF